MLLPLLRSTLHLSNALTFMLHEDDIRICNSFGLVDALPHKRLNLVVSNAPLPLLPARTLVVVFKPQRTSQQPHHRPTMHICLVSLHFLFECAMIPLQSSIGVLVGMLELTEVHCPPAHFLMPLCMVVCYKGLLLFLPTLHECLRLCFKICEDKRDHIIE